jgi:hypothetical protein
MAKDPMDASRSLTYVASLARRHTEACVNVLSGIVSNSEAPPRARMKADRLLRWLERQSELERSKSLPISLKRPRNVPLAENKPR